MKIDLFNIKVKDLIEGYKDKGIDGVTGYGSRLDIRPPYQREFIYKDKQRDAVIDTVLKGYPLNVMYWVRKEDGTFEVLDGQQRTISICQYFIEDFSFNYFNFTSLPEDQREKFLEYELTVYICEGTESQKLEWFKTINIAGEKLTDQELRNAVYAGQWTTEAKKHFSKPQGPAYGIASKYLNGSPIRQDYLETALKWIVNRDGLDSIEAYMTKNQHKTNANELWLYFQNVISWVETLFPTKNYRKEMKGQPWGVFYNKYKNQSFDANKLEEIIAPLMEDGEIQKRSGVYDYVFTGDTRPLNLRQFSPAQKRAAYEKQGGLCANKRAETHDINKKFKIDEMEADHITPWSQGGSTEDDNLQLLCKDCNRRKSNK